MKKIFAVLMVIAVCATFITESFAAELPSDWAVSEIDEAVALNFVPDELQTGYKKNSRERNLLKSRFIILQHHKI